MKPLKDHEIAKLILLTALIFGGWLRLGPVLAAGFPINDGGMFAVMVDDLRVSQYALPVYTSYNLSNIPYAYPPLGFYLGRVTSDLLGFDSVTVARGKGKQKRFGRFMGRRNNWKKAYVRLAEGQEINFAVTE